MNDVPLAGALDLLDVVIRRKAFASATGERREVLHDVAFHLRAGEVGAIVGPSGCGKTTVLRIVAGLDVDFDGHVQRPADGHIGMVFQEPRLLPWRTVEENLRIIAPRASESVLAALFATLGLSAHRAHRPGQLSLGLARRVALARAFAVEPDLLLLDEPFVSLDAPLAAKLREELAILVNGRPVTTLLVTHDLDEAIQLADRILFLTGQPSRLTANVPIAIGRARRDVEAVAAVRRELAVRGFVSPKGPENRPSSDWRHTTDDGAERTKVPKAHGPSPTLT